MFSSFSIEQKLATPTKRPRLSTSQAASSPKKLKIDVSTPSPKPVKRGRSHAEVELMNQVQCERCGRWVEVSEDDIHLFEGEAPFECADYAQRFSR